MILERQRYAVFFSQSTHIEYSITHASQSSINAYMGGVGYLFKAHILVVTHKQHLSLRFGQSIYKVSDIAMYLASHHEVFDSVFAKLLAIKNVEIAVITRLKIFSLLLTEIIYNKVVGNAKNLPFSVYLPCFMVIIALTNVS